MHFYMLSNDLVLVSLTCIDGVWVIVNSEGSIFEYLFPVARMVGRSYGVWIHLKYGV